jgi:hypothetical protein
VKNVYFYKTKSVRDKRTYRHTLIGRRLFKPFTTTKLFVRVEIYLRCLR